MIILQGITALALREPFCHATVLRFLFWAACEQSGRVLVPALNKGEKGYDGCAFRILVHSDVKRGGHSRQARSGHSRTSEMIPVIVR